MKLAVKNNDYHWASFLINSGADPDHRVWFNTTTPFEEAILRKKAKMGRLLLSARYLKKIEFWESHKEEMLESFESV